MLYKYSNTMFLTILLSVIIVIMSIVISQDPHKIQTYEWLFLLPFSNAVILFLISPWSYRIYNNVAKTLIFILYLLRNVITPIFMYLGEYHTVIGATGEEVKFAITLMIYETLIVFIILVTVDKVKFINQNYKLSNKSKIKKLRVLKPLMILLTFFSIFALYKVPMLRDNFKSIFNSDEVANIANITNKEMLVGGLNRIIYTSGQMIINFLRLLLSVWVLGFMKKKTNNKITVTITILFLIGIQSLFITSQAIYIVYIVALIIIVASKLYPNILNTLKKIIPLFVLIFISTLFVTKLKINDNVLSTNEILSASFQAYLPGVTNNAGILNIPSHEKISYLLGDIYYTIPFRNSIFGFNIVDLSNAFNVYNGVNGQILPLLGQSYYYFGFILAPLLPAVFVIGAIWAYMKANYAKDLFRYSAFIMLMLYFSTMGITKNATLFGATYFTTVLPMLILSHFVEKDYEFENLNVK